MKAVVKIKRGPGNIELLEKPIPKVLPGQVLIKVMAAGICGTDIKILHDQTFSNPPVVLGHEYSGIVEEVGEGVTDIAPGDRVVSETAQVICGSCEYCRTGRQLMCPERLSIGYGVDGAFAEYIAVRKEIIHPIPDSMTYDMAALCEPFAVALHGVWDTGSIEPTDTVLVMGPGIIGQLSAVAAVLKGAEVVLAGMPADKERLKIAEKLGIHHTVTEDLEKFILEKTNGKGADVVIDCTGAESAIRQAMSLVKRTGRFVQIGLTKKDLTIEYSLLTGKEISIVGSFGHRWHNWEQAISIMNQNRFDLDKLITSHYTLEEWEQAFSDMDKQKGVKILIHPNGADTY